MSQQIRVRCISCRRIVAVEFPDAQSFCVSIQGSPVVCRCGGATFVPVVFKLGSQLLQVDTKTGKGFRWVTGPIRGERVDRQAMLAGRRMVSRAALNPF